jgi:hypothetical protein
MAPKKGTTPPARTDRADRGRDVDRSRSPSPASSDITSDTPTTHAMMGTITEQLHAFHTRLTSLEATPHALAHALAQVPHVGALRHSWSTTPPRLVPPEAFVKPRRPTIDPDLVLAIQLECEGLDLYASLRHVKLDLPVM